MALLKPKIAIRRKEAIKELTLFEHPEMVYDSNAIKNSTLILEDTEDILIRNQIRTDHEISEIYEAKNLASAIEYFGGLNASVDGMGHSHATIDRNGNVTYLRDAWVTDKKRDYLINENADKFGGETHKF